MYYGHSCVKCLPFTTLDLKGCCKEFPEPCGHNKAGPRRVGAQEGSGTSTIPLQGRLRAGLAVALIWLCEHCAAGCWRAAQTHQLLLQM